MIVVADAGPIIALAQIGQLDLLAALYDRPTIPQEVHREIANSPDLPNGPPPWLRVHGPADRQAVVILNQQLDPGEAEAIVLALELSAPLLIDDLVGRRVATERGVPIIGTLGLLLRAKQADLTERVAPLISALAAAGFWMSEALKSRVIHEAGEG